jgi:hypothetical protein
VWEKGTRVFWALEQTTVTSKCEAGLSRNGGQQTISPTEPTSAATFLWPHPLPPWLSTDQLCSARHYYKEASFWECVDKNPPKKIRHMKAVQGPPLWSGGHSSWLLTQRSRVRFLALSYFGSSSGSGTGSTQPL